MQRKESSEGILHVLVHSTNVHNSQERVRQSQDVRSWASHTGAGAQAFGLSPTTFPGALAGSRIPTAAARTRTGAYIDVGIAGRGLACYITMPGPEVFLYKELIV